MTVTILNGDCRDVLKTLPDRSIQCCVTSPPYYGLRDYGVDGQIGLEKTPDDYVGEMVAVFREVRRVLRDDGVLWLNLGDSYCSTDKWGGGGNLGKNTVAPDGSVPSWAVRQRKAPMEGVKPKDLLGIPWLVAFALRADGWYLRSDIIWHKPNPMPESITDRPTNAHEHVFLLTKSSTYYYDHENAKEPAAYPGDNRAARKDTRKEQDPACMDGGSRARTGTPTGTLRNARNVWTITTKPFRGAHFATMPIDLAERCIKAGTSEHGACRACGTPFKRIVERGEPDLEHQIACGASADGSYDGESTKDYASAGAQDASETKRRILAGMVEKKTVGWEPTCGCENPMPRPCVVLDPFGGAGTTGLAATKLGCDSVLVELNETYVGIAEDRLGIKPPAVVAEPELVHDFW